MIPGEFRTGRGSIVINEGRSTAEIVVTNTGDRPVQVGSHYHFFEVNRALVFQREQAFGMRLDIPAGTAVRFEPGEHKPVQLVALGGAQKSFGLNGLSQGLAKPGPMPAKVCERWQAWKEHADEADRS